MELRVGDVRERSSGVATALRQEGEEWRSSAAAALKYKFAMLSLPLAEQVCEPWV